jgi:cation diffusion facilitator CzcD-associated flavoprotein CzcO
LEKDTQQKGEISCNYLIGGIGALRIPNVPEVFTKFEGPWVHSARWDHSIDLKDKVVGVIGSGASAVQIVPNIINQVNELHVFQRSAPYVVPKGITDYSPWMKFLLKWIPFFQTLYYWYFFLKDEKDIIAFYTDSWASKMATQATEDYIKESFTDPVKAELMRPKYHFGCKRVTPADEYYKAIDNSKTFIHDGNIERVEGKTLYMKDGTSQTLDVLILATGFNVSNPYKDIDIANLDGEHIDTNLDKQGRTPQLNYGITVGKMPNFFMMLGPTTGLGHNSITFILECQANYITKMLKHALYNNITRIELKQEVGDAYWKWVQRRVKPMVWYGNCKSWYQNANGEVIAVWPGTCFEYWWKTYSPNFSEYDMIYKA